MSTPSTRRVLLRRRPRRAAARAWPLAVVGLLLGRTRPAGGLQHARYAWLSTLVFAGGIGKQAAAFARLYATNTCSGALR